MERLHQSPCLTEPCLAKMAASVGLATSAWKTASGRDCQFATNGDDSHSTSKRPSATGCTRAGCSTGCSRWSGAKGVACPPWAPPTPPARAAAWHTTGCARVAWPAVLTRRPGQVRAASTAWPGAVERPRPGPAARRATSRNPRDWRAERRPPPLAHATESASATAGRATGPSAPAQGCRPARRPRQPDRRSARCWPHAAALPASGRCRPRTMPAMSRSAQGQPDRRRRAHASGHRRSGGAGAWQGGVSYGHCHGPSATPAVQPGPHGAGPRPQICPPMGGDNRVTAWCVAIPPSPTPRWWAPIPQPETPCR